MSTQSLYDLYLGDISSLQGYRCRSYSRDSAPLIAPKFSSGAQGQTDLDLLKSASVDNVAGGMFQRTHEDSSKVARSVGFYNAYDENLYPALDFTYSTAIFSAGTAYKVENNAYSFTLFRSTSGGQTFFNIRKVVGTTLSTLTHPSSGTPTTVGVGNMCIHKGYLYIATSVLGFAALNTQRYSILAGTWQDIGLTDALYVSMRGILYSLDSSANVYSVTNETIAGAATRTLIATVGGNDLAANEAVELNGAAWIAKDDGMYRFDGVTAVKVLNLDASLLTSWNGSLYFMANKWLHRFDGSNVVKLQYFAEPVYQMSTHPDYLLIQTWVTSTIADTPKNLGGTSGTTRVYTYNSVGFSIVLERNVTTETSTVSHALICNNDYLYYIQPQNSGASWDAQYSWRVNLANRMSAVGAGVTTNSVLELTSSEFDDGYPNIYKSLEYIEPLYSGLVAGDLLTVAYQYYDGKTWSAWLTAGTLDYLATQNLVQVVSATTKLFKRLKVNVNITTVAGSTARLKGVGWRYSLQPRTRWRWQVLLMAEGNGVVNDRAGTSITTDSNALTNNVLKAIRQKTPVFMLSPDYGQVKTQINNAVLSFIVKGQAPVYTDPYSEYPLVSVKNNNGVWEVLRVSTVSYNSGTDETTITVLERGYYGVTAAQINAGAEFHLCYQVYVTRLLRDASVLDNNTYHESDTTGISQLQREFLIELVEV